MSTILHVCSVVFCLVSTCNLTILHVWSVFWQQGGQCYGRPLRSTMMKANGKSCRFLLFLAGILSVTAWNMPRRQWMSTMASTMALAPWPAHAAAKDSTVTAITEATTTLQTLLDNWGKAVIDCTYADVPRELLEAKNKELLLEKASTFALFDKSVSIVSCKTNNRIVRDYLGRTGKGPLVGLDKRVRAALDLVEDPDDLDAFVQASEALQQALSRADSLSYAAAGDFTSINNFDKEEESKVLATENTNLAQSKRAIQEAVDNLNVILKIIRA